MMRFSIKGLYLIFREERGAVESELVEADRSGLQPSGTNSCGSNWLLRNRKYFTDYDKS